MIDTTAAKKYKVAIVSVITLNGEVDIPAGEKPAEYIENLYRSGELSTELVAEDCLEIQFCCEGGEVSKIFPSQPHTLETETPTEIATTN